MADHGFETLTLPVAETLLSETEFGLHSGDLRPNEAERRLNTVDRFLKTHPAQVGLSLRVLALKGSVCNHQGRSAEAEKYSLQAQQLARSRNHDVAYVRSTAIHIVALVDGGYIADARREGELLVEFAVHGAHGDDDDLKVCRMFAHGVLGGQPLYQAALADSRLIKQSQQHLEKALEEAISLAASKPRKYNNEVRRDAGYLAQLSMCCSPFAMKNAFEAARKIFDQHPVPPGEDATSCAYLYRNRWFGAYRKYLLTGRVTAGYEDWPLPDKEIAHDSWLTATSLKYRGTLLAADGRNDLASEDFTLAVELLCRAEDPLAHFIGATAAWQAGQSLAARRPAIARKLASRSRRIFNSLGKLVRGVCAASKWKMRPGHRHPQNVFAY